jgi:outer membrane protein
MTMKKLLLIAIFGSGLYTTTRAQEKWDLRKCVDYALANNISVRQADVQARLSKLTLDQSKLSQIPTLIGNLSGSVNAGRSQDPTNFQLNTFTSYYSNPSLQSNVTVYNFQSLRNAIEANRLSWMAALAGSDRTKNDLSLNVANAYLQVLLAMKATETADSTLNLSQRNLELTRKQVNAGTLPELNAAELEAQVAQDSANYISTQGVIEADILTLKAYMGLDAGTPFDVATPPIEDIPVEPIADLQPDIVYALAVTSQPLQRMDSFQIAAARSSVQSYKGARLPTLSAGGQLSSTFVKSSQFQSKGYFDQINQNFAQYVGINIYIPILNNGVLRTNYARSKLNLQNYQLQRDQDNLTLKQNIYQAYTAAMTAMRKFEANKISLAATQKSYDFAQKRYNVGMLNTIDLLTNQNNLANARINLLTSEFDYVFKMKVLEFYKGLGVKLSKQ